MIASYIETCLVLKSLAPLDTSKTERLETASSIHPSGGYLYQALLSMENLRSLMLSRCENLSAFVDA